MNQHDSENQALNILAQYYCRHLSWGAAVWELAHIGIPPEAIVTLLDFEDGME